MQAPKDLYTIGCAQERRILTMGFAYYYVELGHASTSPPGLAHE